MCKKLFIENIKMWCDIRLMLLMMMVVLCCSSVVVLYLLFLSHLFFFYNYMKSLNLRTCPVLTKKGGVGIN